MARLPYEQDQSIHSMNARQLRQYIADKATEAQNRIDSVDLSEASKAFRDMASGITGRGGKVKRSTSYMTVPEMREYAYELRQFNSMDRESKFQESIEWKENREKYLKFMHTQLESGDAQVKQYWSKYLTPNGNISIKGFQEYMKYRLFLEQIEDIKEKYGYRTLKGYYREATTAYDKQQLERLLLQVYKKSENKGWTPDQLNDAFAIVWEEYKQKQAEKPEKLPKKAPAAKPRKPKKAPASGNKVKIKQGRKMRTSETVREKLT